MCVAACLQAELTDCVSLLVGNNERIQAIVSQLDETCRAVDVSGRPPGETGPRPAPSHLEDACLQENGRRQKSRVCETFDRLFALLEEKKGEMTVSISCEQEEKLDYIRSLNRKYSKHLEETAKLLETAIQTMDEPEMAVFLQVTLNAALIRE